MLKISRALRVVALSALMLGAVLADDLVADADIALAAAEKALKAAEDAAAAEAAAAAADPDKAAGAGAAEPGVDVAAAAVPDAAVPVAPTAPVAAEPVAEDAVDPAAEDVDDAGGGAGNGLYFFVTKQGPMRCFVISQGKGSRFHVHYDFPEAEDGKEVRLELRHLPLQGPRRKRLDQKPITTRTISTKHGSYQFELKTGGSHSLCAVTDSQHGVRGLRLSLDLDTGELYAPVKKKLNLDDMQISMIQLKNRARELLREADFVQELETDYHKNVLRLNREVLWWPISQVVMLLIMGFFQVRHLKKFFKNKRLV